MTTSLKSLVNDFSHLFFPHVCAGCGNDNLSHQSALCIQCTDQLPLTNFHDYKNNPVEKYFWGRIPINGASALCHFTEGSLIQHLLHQLKYKSNKEIGYFLGRMLGNSLKHSERFNDVDIIIPLPLFASRQKKRGYNQSEILSVGMAEILQHPVINNAVIRLMATETQTHKNRIERWINMEGKFELTKPTALTSKHILLVDDVITTGATLEACAQKIQEAVDVKISIATLAYTV